MTTLEGTTDLTSNFATRLAGASGPSAPTTAQAGLLDLTVIVPTRNEIENVDALIESIRRVLATSGYRYEILFVDDSDDRTPEAITAHVGTGAPVRLLHRRPGTRAGGLGGALCAGFADARGRHALCIDGDLQHPPELLAPMARVLVDGTADLVVGTRYLAGGASDGLDGRWRRFVSAATRDLARLALPRVRESSDPGSGLFGFDLAIIDGVDLKPLGYKTLIEVLARGNWSSLAEVPYRFEARSRGSSNASLREGVRFLRHLAGLVADGNVRRRRSGPSSCTAFGVPHEAAGVPCSHSTLVLHHVPN